MARKRSHASRAVLPRGADDFKLIKGIGPAIERRLHRAGIRTFARLAALSPDEVAALILGLSAERVAKQGWIRQARKLAPKQARAKPHKEVATTGRQHYENFTVELLLDENDEARRTRVVHVQSGDADTWAGWEAERLIDFLARHTEARSPAAKPVPLVAAIPEPVPSVATAVEPVPKVTATPEPVPQVAASIESVPPVPVAKHAPLPVPAASLAGVLRLHGLETVPTNVNKPQSILPHGQAFEVRFSLDLTNVTAPDNFPLNYIATVYAKKVGGGPRQLVGEARSTIELSESVTLSVAGISLPPGVYRLEALVRLAPAGAEPGRQPGLTAFLKGDLVQVY